VGTEVEARTVEDRGLVTKCDVSVT
jgi:hypothetical protein